MSKNVKKIKLTQGQVALVDATDYARLSQYKWHAHWGRSSKTWYAQTNIKIVPGKYRQVQMHRFLLGINDQKLRVDHRDGNGLNNRRNNIRPATPAQNARNRKKANVGNISGFLGVGKHGGGKWQATLTTNGKSLYLGLYTDPVAAAKAHDKAALQHHGEFAAVNFSEQKDRKADNRLQSVYYVDSQFSFDLNKYNQLLEFQKGCAICGKYPTNSLRLSVDHCHDSGLLRGLLCFRCNKGYSLFHDNDYNRLRRAADYLQYPPFVKLFGVRHTAPGRIGTQKRAKLLFKMKEKSG